MLLAPGPIPLGPAPAFDLTPEPPALAAQAAQDLAGSDALDADLDQRLLALALFAGADPDVAADPALDVLAGVAAASGADPIWDELDPAIAAMAEIDPEWDYAKIAIPGEAWVDPLGPIEWPPNASVFIPTGPYGPLPPVLGGGGVGGPPSRCPPGTLPPNIIRKSPPPGPGVALPPVVQTRIPPRGRVAIPPPTAPGEAIPLPPVVQIVYQPAQPREIPPARAPLGTIIVWQPGATLPLPPVVLPPFPPWTPCDPATGFVRGATTPCPPPAPGGPEPAPQPPTRICPAGCYWDDALGRCVHEPHVRGLAYDPFSDLCPPAGPEGICEQGWMYDPQSGFCIWILSGTDVENQIALAQGAAPAPAACAETALPVPGVVVGLSISTLGMPSPPVPAQSCSQPSPDGSYLGPGAPMPGSGQPSAPPAGPPEISPPPAGPLPLPDPSLYLAPAIPQANLIDLVLGYSSLMHQGDGWLLDVSAAGGAPVSLHAVHNGVDLGVALLGTTDAYGKWTSTSAWTVADVGDWIWEILVGGAAANPLQFTVLAVTG